MAELVRGMFADIVRDSPGVRSARVLEEQSKLAELTYKRVVDRILSFEAGLRPDEEVGARLVTAPEIGAFHVVDVSYSNPNLLVFRGVSNGGVIELIQDISQLSIVLIAMKTAAGEPPRRLGFLAGH